MLENMNVSGVSREIGVSNTNLSLMSRSAGEAGPSEVRGTEKGSDFSRIETLIKGNTFSREEIHSLLEILNSRMEVEPEKNKASPSAGVDGRQFTLMTEIPRTPVAEKHQDLDRIMVPVGVGASPIDIARAFMAARNTEQTHDTCSLTSKIERNQTSNDFARNQLMQSPSAKSSTCWPGAMVQDHRGYTTPQCQRGRYGHRGFPRAPYSRTNLSKSTSKLQADSRFTNTSTPFQQSRTSNFGQAVLRTETVDGYGSVDPIRRIKNKYATEVLPRGGSIFLNSPKMCSSKVAKPNPLSGFSSSPENNLECGETSGASKNWSTDNVLGSSDVGFREPTSSSNQAVKKILEHLNRNKPTPKEKEEELKVATAWRSSSVAAASNSSSLHFGEPSSTKSTDVAGAEIPAELTKSSSLFNSLGQFQVQGVDGPNDAFDNNAKAVESFFTGSSRTSGSNALPPFGLKGSSEHTVNNLHETSFRATNNGPKELSFSFARHSSNVPDVKSVAGPTTSDPSKNHGSKPSLSSISVSRAYSRPVSSDNGPGFSFPVSTSAGGVSEPPTPSFLPSSTQVSVPTVPSYTFGANKSTRLVFSFPSTSTASAPEEASDLNFTFGSDEKARLSFGSFGEDSNLLLT